MLQAPVAHLKLGLFARSKLTPPSTEDKLALKEIAYESYGMISKNRENLFLYFLKKVGPICGVAIFSTSRLKGSD